MNVGTAVGYLDLDTSKFKNGLQTARQQLQGFTDSTNSMGSRISSLGGALKTAGATMTKSFTVPILGAGIAAGKMAMDTNESMSKVNSILQLGAKEFSSYEQTLKKGAQEIGMAYSDYANAAYDAISAGVEQGKVTEFLTGANKLAKGGLTDLTSATNLLTTAQNAYGLSQSDLAHVSDVLIQTQNKGKVTVNELASCMGKIIPTAKSLGVNMDQLGAGYSIMTAKGIASAEATTYMNAMFNELGKSGTKVDGALKQISGKSFKELTESGKSTGDILQMLSDYAQKSGLSLSDLFGSAEAGKAALTLLSGGAEEFNNMLNTMSNSAGATDKAFNEMNNTAKEKLTQSFASFKNALSDVGTSMQPVIEFVAQIITKFSEFISRLAQTNPALLNFMVVLAGVLAAIGPVLLIVGQLCVAIGGLVTFFSAGGVGATLLAGAIGLITGPVGIVIGVIGALITIGVALYKNWDTIKAKCLEVWNNIKSTISSSWDNVKTTTLNTWDNIKSTISSTTNSIKSVITTVFNAIKSFIQTIVNGWKNIIQTVWSSIKTVVSSGVNAVKTVITTAFNAIKTVIQTVTNGWKNILTTCWSGIKSVVSSGANAVRSTIRSVFSTITNILTAPFKAAQKVISGILGGISSAVSKVTSGISKVTSAFKRSIDNPNAQIQTASVDDINYKMARFELNKAREATISDALATNYSLVEGIQSFSKGINNKTKVNDGNNFDYKGFIDKLSNVTKEIIVPINLDGKQIAKVIAPYSEVESGSRLNYAERGLVL